MCLGWCQIGPRPGFGGRTVSVAGVDIGPWPASRPTLWFYNPRTATSLVGHGHAAKDQVYSITVRRVAARSHEIPLSLPLAALRGAHAS